MIAAALLVNPQHPSRPVNGANQISEYMIHDPPEYCEYIMLGDMQSYGPGMVMAAFQTGMFVSDANAVFAPGVRLYFDSHRIIRDGLGTRDGSHTLKVHHRLPLQPYLIAAVCSSDLEPHVSKRRWTIKSFVEQANETF